MAGVLRSTHGSQHFARGDGDHKRRKLSIRRKDRALSAVLSEKVEPKTETNSSLSKTLKSLP